MIDYITKENIIIFNTEFNKIIDKELLDNYN